MPRPVPIGWLWRFATVAVAVFCDAGDLLAQDKPAAAQPAAKVETTADAARKKALIADMDAALKLLQGKKYHEFLETYAPVEDVRRIRAEDSWKQVAAAFLTNGEQTAALMKLLRGIKTGEIRFEAHGYEAVIELSDPDASAIASAAAQQGKKVAVEVPIPDSEGLGDDLNDVLELGAKLVRENKFESFVSGLYPQSMVRELHRSGRMDAFARQLKANNELQTALASDFAALRKLKPEISEQGRVATFTLKAAARKPSDDGEENGKVQPAGTSRDRLIKFELSDGNWRFFDASKKAMETIDEWKSAKAASAAPTIKLEKIGGNWRFLTFEGIVR